jgi:hypothetical protein
LRRAPVSLIRQYITQRCLTSVRRVALGLQDSTKTKPSQPFSIVWLRKYPRYHDLRERMLNCRRSCADAAVMNNRRRLIQNISEWQKPSSDDQIGGPHSIHDIFAAQKNSLALKLAANLRACIKKA